MEYFQILISEDKKLIFPTLYWTRFRFDPEFVACSVFYHYVSNRFRFRFDPEFVVDKVIKS